MANLTIHRDNENRIAALAPSWASASEGRWDPFRMVRDLMGWDPFREMAPYVQQLPAGFLPAFEIKESKDGYLFKADLPGVKDGDIDVTITGNRLTISGKREAEKQDQSETYYAYERSYGTFTRTFTLPEGVDTNSTHADLKDGVLSLWIKKTPEAQPKKVSVQTAAKKS